MLPKNEATFELNVEGEITGEKYAGSFTCICVPTVGIRNRISRDQIRETGDLANTTDELFLRAMWLANVQGRLIGFPDWWDALGRGSRLIDDNVLKEVYDRCIEAEVEWRKNVKAKAAESTPQTPPA
jgi:hypothetical protein